MITFECTSELWLYKGDGAWVFATIPQDISQEIKAMTTDITHGFGSVRVAVSLNGTTWHTSIFPDKKTGCYFLPVKRDVRTKAHVAIGDMAHISFQLLDLV